MKQLARFPQVQALLLLTAGLASAQERPERGRRPAPAEKASEAQAQVPASLDAARAAFRAADANADGLLDAVEAGGAGIDARWLSEADSDGTAGLSGDEFVVAFQRKAEREQRGVAPELSAETARILGARTRPAVQPQPAPTQPPAAAAAAPTHEEKLKAILESLNERVRKSQLSKDEALATYASVSKRLDNALLGTAGVQGTLSKEDYLKQVKEHLNTRVRKAELSDADALALYQRVAQRIDTALTPSQPASETAPPVTQPESAPAPQAPPAEGQPPAPQDGAQRPRQPDGNAPPTGGVRRAREPLPEGAPPREGGNARPRRPAPEDKPAGGGL
jgi:hypothetical protein